MPLATVCNTHLLCEIGLTYTFVLYLDYVFIVFRGLKLHVNIRIINPARILRDFNLAYRSVCFINKLSCNV